LEAEALAGLLLRLRVVDPTLALAESEAGLVNSRKYELEE
jgi:hypothetical protein